MGESSFILLLIAGMQINIAIPARKHPLFAPEPIEMGPFQVDDSQEKDG